MRWRVFFSCFSAMIFMAASNLLADALVDDCEAKGQNQFGYYWFFFDDNADGGNSTIPGVPKDGTKYTITMSTGGHSGKCLALPYKLGPKATTKEKINYIGCGTMLCPDKDSLNIAGVTAITFWIKSDKETMVDFMVLTKDIKDYAYYHKVVTAPTEWTKDSVAISDLKQPGWQATDVAFNPKCVTRLQWQLHTDNVGKDSSGAIYLDDIIITGFNFIAPDQCPSCVGAPDSGAQLGALLSDAPPSMRNARNYYWFCYNDSKNHVPPVLSQSEFSQIVAGAAIDGEDMEKNPTLAIDSDVKKGYNNTPGAYIKFRLGPTFRQSSDSTNIVRPFVGLGTLLSEGGTTTDVYDAKADGATGIYFDYMLASSSPNTELKLEVYANDFKMGGVVHYIKIPATCAAGETVWKGATIPFSKLKLPNWDGVNQTVTLDATIMKKLQWAVQDAPGVKCELAIDNVYFVGATKISVANGVKFQGVARKEGNTISASLIKNFLKISLPLGTSNASIALVDTRGAIASTISQRAGQSVIMNIKGLSRGVYILMVKKKTNSSDFTKAIPITIY